MKTKLSILLLFSITNNVLLFSADSGLPGKAGLSYEEKKEVELYNSSNQEIQLKFLSKLDEEKLAYLFKALNLDLEGRVTFFNILSLVRSELAVKTRAELFSKLDLKEKLELFSKLYFKESLFSSLSLEDKSELFKNLPREILGFDSLKTEEILELLNSLKPKDRFKVFDKLEPLEKVNLFVGVNHPDQQDALIDSLKDKPDFLKDFSITFASVFIELIDKGDADGDSFAKQLPFLEKSGLLKALKENPEGEELLTKLVSVIKDNSGSTEDIKLLEKYGISLPETVYVVDRPPVPTETAGLFGTDESLITGEQTLPVEDV